MSFYGVQLNSQVNKLLFEIRLQLSRNKYTPNLRTIHRSLADFDRDLSGKIQSFNFEHALNANGLFFKKYELQVFEKAFGGQGFINWFTFLTHLKEPMGPLRRQTVELIFDSIDKNKKGSLSPEELLTHFNASEIEAYRQGKRSLKQVQEHFLGMLSMPQGVITKEQFIAFYDDCNINFPHNDIFNRYVCSQWHYTPEKKQGVYEQAIRAATKSIRYKLIEKTQGTKDELLIRKLFNQYDKNSCYYLSPYDFGQLAATLGVQAQPGVLEVIHQRIDKNQSGYIQFEEFKKFLFYDPYPY